jgi:hypothetical protein
MATKLNLLIEQGASFSQQIFLSDDNDDPLIIANTTTATGKLSKHPSSSNVYMFDTALSNGELIISMPSDRTANIAPGDYRWNIDLHNREIGVYDPKPSNNSPHTAGARTTYTRNAAQWANCANVAATWYETNAGINGYYMWFYVTNANGTPTDGAWGNEFNISFTAKPAGRSIFLLDVVSASIDGGRSFRINLELGTIESVNSSISQTLASGYKNKGKIVNTSITPTISRKFGIWENNFDTCGSVWGFSANLAGTVAVQSSNTIVVGTGTQFETDFAPGGWIAIWSNSTSYSEKFIMEIANNTHLTLDTGPSFSNTAAKYRESQLQDWFDISITLDFELPNNYAITQYFWLCGNDGNWIHTGNSGLGIHMTDPIISKTGTVTRLVEGNVTITADV